MEEQKTIRRYPGIQAFSYTDRKVFFGRSEEVEALADAVTNEKLVVLHGKSGYGKSSLVQAGLKPALKKVASHEKSVSRVEVHYLPITIRFKQFNETDSLLTRFDANFGEEIKQFQNLNKAPFLFPDLPNTLWGRLKKYDFTPEHRLLLMFDQFEEFFGYPLDQQELFIRQLSDLLYPQYPYYLKIKDREQTLSEAEQDFLRFKINVRALFIIRADRLHEIEGVKRFLPQILQRTIELGPFTLAQAEAAILGPAERTDSDLLVGYSFASPPFEYREEAVEALKQRLKAKHFLRQNLIEPFLLQLFCKRIEDKVICGDIPDRDENGLSDVEPADLPANDLVLEHYYEDALAVIEEKLRPAALELLETVLIKSSEDGTQARRISWDSRSATRVQEAHGLNSPRLLGQLEASYLIRKERNSTYGNSYELIHDVFLAPVLKYKRERQLKEKVAELEEQNVVAQEEVQELKVQKEKTENKYTGVKYAAVLLCVVAGIVGYFAYLSSQATKNERNSKLNLLSSYAILNIAKDPTVSLRLFEASMRVDSSQRNPNSAKITQLYNNHVFAGLYDRRVAPTTILKTVANENGERMMILTEDGRLFSLDLTEPNLGELLQIHHRIKSPNAVKTLALSLDGNFLAWGYTSGKMGLYNLTNEVASQLETPHTEGVNSIHFSPNGKYLISGSNDFSFHIHRTQDARFLAGQKLKQEVIDVIFASDQAFAVATTGKVAYAYHFKNEKISGQKEVPAGKLPDLDFINFSAYTDEENDYIVSFFNSGVYKKTTIPKSGTLIKSTEMIKQTTFPYTVARYIRSKEAEDVFVFGDYEGKISIETDYRYRDFAPTILPTSHEDAITNVIVSLDQHYFATAATDELVKIWSAKGKLLATLPGHTDYKTSVAFTKDGKGLLTTVGAEVRRYQLNESGIVNKISAPGKLLLGAYDALDDVSYGATAQVDGFVNIYRFSSKGETMFTFDSPGLKATDKSKAVFQQLNYTSDSTLVAVSSGGKIHVGVYENSHFSPMDYGPLTHKSSGDGAIISHAFSADGRQLLSTSSGGSIYAFDMRNGNKTELLDSEINRPPFNFIHTLYRTADDSSYLFNIYDRNIRRYLYPGPNLRSTNIDSLEQYLLLPEIGDHIAPISCVQVDANQNFMLTAAGDNAVILYAIEEENFRKEEIINEHAKGVQWVDFSSEGNYLVSADGSGTIRIFTGPSSESVGDLLLTISESYMKINYLHFDEATNWLTLGDRSGYLWKRKIVLDPVSVRKRIKEEFEPLLKFSDPEKKNYGLDKMN